MNEFLTQYEKHHGSVKTMEALVKYGNKLMERCDTNGTSPTIIHSHIGPKVKSNKSSKSHEIQMIPKELREDELNMIHPLSKYPFFLIDNSEKLLKLGEITNDLYEYQPDPVLVKRKQELYDKYDQLFGEGNREVTYQWLAENIEKMHESIGEPKKVYENNEPSHYYSTVEDRKKMNRLFDLPKEYTSFVDASQLALLQKWFDIQPILVPPINVLLTFNRTDISTHDHNDILEEYITNYAPSLPKTITLFSVNGLKDFQLSEANIGKVFPIRHMEPVTYHPIVAFEHGKREKTLYVYRIESDDIPGFSTEISGINPQKLNDCILVLPSCIVAKLTAVKEINIQGYNILNNKHTVVLNTYCDALVKSDLGNQYANEFSFKVFYIDLVGKFDRHDVLTQQEHKKIEERRTIARKEDKAYKIATISKVPLFFISIEETAKDIIILTSVESFDNTAKSLRMRNALNKILSLDASIVDLMPNTKSLKRFQDWMDTHPIDYSDNEVTKPVRGITAQQGWEQYAKDYQHDINSVLVRRLNLAFSKQTRRLPFGTLLYRGWGAHGSFQDFTGHPSGTKFMMLRPLSTTWNPHVGVFFSRQVGEHLPIITVFRVLSDNIIGIPVEFYNTGTSDECEILLQPRIELVIEKIEQRNVKISQLVTSSIKTSNLLNFGNGRGGISDDPNSYLMAEREVVIYYVDIIGVRI